MTRFRATLWSLCIGVVLFACSESSPVQVGNDDDPPPPAAPAAPLDIEATGLAGAVTLEVNSDTVSVDAEGTTRVADSLLVGSTYSIRILGMPSTQSCLLGGEGGSVADTTVITVPLGCADGYTATDVSTTLPQGSPDVSTLQVVSSTGGTQAVDQVEAAGLRASDRAEIVFVTDDDEAPILLALLQAGQEELELSPQSTAISLIALSDFLTGPYAEDPEGVVAVLEGLPETAALASTIGESADWATFADPAVADAFTAAIVAAAQALFPPTAGLVEYERGERSGLSIVATGEDGLPETPRTQITVNNDLPRWVRGVPVVGPEYITDENGNPDVIPGPTLHNQAFWIPPAGEGQFEFASHEYTIDSEDIDGRGIYIHLFGDGGQRSPTGEENPFGLKGFAEHERRYYSQAVLAQTLDAVYITQISSALGVPNSCIRGILIDDSDPTNLLNNFAEALTQLQEIAQAIGEGDVGRFRAAVRGEIARRIFETALSCAEDDLQGDVDGILEAQRDRAYKAVLRVFLRLSTSQIALIGQIQTALAAAETIESLNFDGYAGANVEEYFEITNRSKGTRVRVSSPDAFSESTLRAFGQNDPQVECPEGHQCDRFVYDRFTPEALQIDYEFFCNNTQFDTGEPDQSCRRATVDFDGVVPLIGELGGEPRSVPLLREDVWLAGSTLEAFRGKFRLEDLDGVVETTPFQLELVEAMPDLEFLLDGEAFNPDAGLLLPGSVTGQEVERVLTVRNRGLGTARLDVEETSTTSGEPTEVIRLESAPGGLTFEDGMELPRGSQTNIAFRYQGGISANPINVVRIGDELDPAYDILFRVTLGAPADSTAEYRASVIREWEVIDPATGDLVYGLRIYDTGRADYVYFGRWDGRFCPGRGGRRDGDTLDCLYPANWNVFRSQDYQYFLNTSGFYAGGMRYGPLTIPPSEVNGFRPILNETPDDPPYILLRPIS